MNHWRKKLFGSGVLSVLMLSSLHAAFGQTPADAPARSRSVTEALIRSNEGFLFGHASPDGTWAYQFEGNQLSLIDLVKPGQPQKQFGDGFVLIPSFSPDSSYLVVGKTNGQVVVFDKQGRQRLQFGACAGEKEQVAAVAIDQAGHLFTACPDRSVAVWQWDQTSTVHLQQRILFEQLEPAQPVISIAVSADGQYLTVPGYLHNVHTFKWDARAKEYKALWAHTIGRIDALFALYEKNARYLLLYSVLNKGEIWVLDPGTGKPIANFLQDFSLVPEPLTEFQFSPDGKSLFGLSGDVVNGTLKFRKVTFDLGSPISTTQGSRKSS